MGVVAGPVSWLTAGSDVEASLPVAALDPTFGTFAPEDALTVLEDFGREVHIGSLGTARILFDDLQFTDENNSPVDLGRAYKLARIPRGAFGGARLSQQVLEIRNADNTARSLFTMIGPVPRDSSLFDRYVLEPVRKEAA